MTIIKRFKYGFSLGELLVAVLFISIAFFAYVALQQRLLISTGKNHLHSLESEKGRNKLIQEHLATRNGLRPECPQISEVNPGLYKVNITHSWEDNTLHTRTSQQLSEELEVWTATRRQQW